MTSAKFSVIDNEDVSFNPFNLDSYEATGIAEGWIEENDPERVVAAWQYLIDTGLAWALQGFFGRGAQSMIDQGLCHESKPVLGLQAS